MLLPQERRQALSVVYAFFRACDDYSDEGGSTADRRRALDEWRERLQRVYDDPGCAAELGGIFPAFAETVQKYAIPARYFHQLLDGSVADLDTFSYETFDELYRYCYRVASTVGLVCVHIFGFDGSEETLKLAEWCGIAFQLTNIIRDVEEDVNLGRVYLPQEDLRGYELSMSDLVCPPADDRFRRLMQFQGDRAQAFYDRSAPLLERINPESRAGFSAMVAIYHGLLKKIEREEFNVHGRRIRLSTWQKLTTLARTWYSTRVASSR